jgi:hypothetical protein
MIGEQVGQLIVAGPLDLEPDNNPRKVTSS